MTGEQLRRLREAHGIGQQELALRAGVSIGHLCNVEVGRRALSEKTENALLQGMLQIIEERREQVLLVSDSATIPDWWRERVLSAN